MENTPKESSPVIFSKLFPDTILLCSPNWPQICDPPSLTNAPQAQFRLPRSKHKVWHKFLFVDYPCFLLFRSFYINWSEELSQGTGGSKEGTGREGSSELCSGTPMRCTFVFPSSHRLELLCRRLPVPLLVLRKVILPACMRVHLRA